MNSNVRPLDRGMGEAVFRRTVGRTHAERETWREVTERVAWGHVSLDPSRPVQELLELASHIASGRVLMSGRHLQHGDSTQPDRNLEIFTNCSTAAVSYLKFLLLLNGSGVGRRYDDALMVVDWSKMPRIHLLLSKDHPDYTGEFPTTLPETVARYHRVHDSREGWAKVVELLEGAAFRGGDERTYVFDFSDVRPAGAPIVGMQNRPSSGPVPFMRALQKIDAMVRKPADRWETTMRVDHVLAECVVVGGARRSARSAVKLYSDPGIFEFIHIKDTADFDTLMWSANNSIGVDAAFWEQARIPGTREERIFLEATRAGYEHASGEPGFLNLDKLHSNSAGLEVYDDGRFTASAGYDKYQSEPESAALESALVAGWKELPYRMAVNPCFEISLSALGGYCVIGDVAPFHAETLEEAHSAFAHTTRALMRVNTLPALYQKEVRRTNRIGVGVTGVHEFAWKFFGLTFRELIAEFDLLMNPETETLASSFSFWNTLRAFRTTVETTAASYATTLGVSVPHTLTCAKPSGSVSKLFGLTEGVHLPAMRYYLRWVQFKDSDPLVADYEEKGYPVQTDLGLYRGMTIVGFPTAPKISQLGIPDDALVTADEASATEQYRWLMLLEHFFLGTTGNQLSYTLKLDTSAHTFDEYARTVLTYQPLVRCCSVLPTTSWTTTRDRYGYVPEEPISKGQYLRYVQHLTGEATEEEVSREHVECAGGSCPIDFSERAVVAVAAS